MKEKKQLSPEETYKKNQKTSKTLKVLSPVVFWVFLALSILCLVLAIQNSFGNVVEIMHLLENKNYTGAELEENYAYLVEKYGEWVIGNGGNGFTITFVNIGHALFSGLMVTNLTLSLISFSSAFILGKWILPKISAQILIENQDMVNLTILKKNDKE